MDSGADPEQVLKYCPNYSFSSAFPLISKKPEASIKVCSVELGTWTLLGDYSPFGSIFWFFVFQSFFDSFDFLIFSLYDPPKTVGIEIEAEEI